MTKTEAYEHMEKGYKVRHEYYSDHEYVFLNKNGELQTEEGCRHGTKNDEFWTKYQIWEEGWSIHRIEMNTMIPFSKLEIGDQFECYGDIHLNYDHAKICLCVKTGEGSAEEIDGISFFMGKSDSVFVE